MDEALSLKHLKPLAAGSTRYVYQHPDDPDLIVKVIRPELVERRFYEGSKYSRRHRKYRQFIIYLREVREHLAIHARNEGDAHFLQSVVGFVNTDMGLGLVLRAVHGRDGRPAQSLETLICERRFTEAARHDLETFIEHVRNSGVLIADFNAGNIVYGYDAVHGDHFVLIDGLGEKTLIPVKSMSRLLNRYSKWKHFRRLRAEIERLAADPSRRRKRKNAIPAELTSQAG